MIMFIGVDGWALWEDWDGLLVKGTGEDGVDEDELVIY